MESILQSIKNVPKLPIIVLICGTVISIYILKWLINRNSKLVSLSGIGDNAKNEILVESDKLIKHRTNTGLNWSLCFWIYIDDLNYKFNKQKQILSWKNCNIWLSKNNDLYIKLEKYDNKHSKIVFERIPIQKWLHISVIYDDRNLDLWINGKLYSSIYLDNIQNFDKNANMTICPNGGFSGYISKFKYYNYAIVRKAVLNIDSIYIQYLLTPFPIIYKIPIIGHILRLIKFLFSFILDLPLISQLFKLLKHIYKFFYGIICNTHNAIIGIIKQTGI